MEQYTLIGHPLGHSMSPFIHERLFAMAGREASYTLTDIAPEHLAGKEPYLRSLQGFNITIPHKMAIIPIVDELDESAKRYNSVNCVANQNGKLIGAAQRVPTPTGSTTILNAVVKGTVTVEQVNAQMKAEATESFGYNTDEIVSSDIIGMRFGSLFDATQTMVLPLPNGDTQVQVVSWYDNENSYTSQMVRTIKYFSELG